ncbi:hypothetical protein FN846DRAFT_454559 [Sphaerosporella brunnea]|uniref:ATP-dependent DNA helicase n=1 Tax=Sphaerosporella brunnea TaxID=1250544 RepID=A0A5J5EEL3_9PEZI|nr:hypothetical protein FN846DRAFT_454559 [Sphaerosporella brunnea]
MDYDEHFGIDIDDAEFIAIVTQAEQQLSSGAKRSVPNDQNNADDNDLLLSDDELNDVDVDFASVSQLPAPPQGNLRQTRLFGGGAADDEPSQSLTPRRNWPLVSNQEPPTHHKLDHAAISTWVYPINVSYRDYQYNIVRRALLSNVLCALPTGLGKTFIAATVMLNWFRWAPEGQIAFLAPTKPLVHQQIEACFNIAGIPRSKTATMTGGVAKALRQEYWEERRVFFTTPQTIQNDIKNGLCDARRIVCLVVDEAHRTTGAYAYGEVVKLIRRVNNSFRVLALTATPGSTVESVQGVIDALGIARVEIRTDESIDIRQYIKKRHVEVKTFPPSDNMLELRDLYCKCLEPGLKKLNQAKAFYQTRAELLTPFAVISAMKEWMFSSQAKNLNTGHYYSLIKIFKNLASLAHALVLLNTHGVRLFYDRLVNAREDQTDEEVNKSAVNSIRKEPAFTELVDRAAAIVSDPNFSGHPKVDYMVNAILRHFAEAEDEDTKRSTRIMVFTSFRESAEEVARLLARHEPMIRPHIFVGQANAKGSSGMSQKQQLEIISKFSDGTYNTIVSTSIGEEGLDIGEVDLIVCYDTSASPIRLLQRMGRTGRKRVGSVLILLSEGKEQDSYKRALDNYAVMQRKIASGNDFTFPHNLSPRILPKDVDPQPDKRHIDIPIENTQPEPTKRRAVAKKKAPAKKFFMPEGVRAGFTKASRIGKEAVLSTDSSGSESEENQDVIDLGLESEAPVLNDSAGLLTEEEEGLLYKNYVQDFSTEGSVLVGGPFLDKFPERQRALTRTNLVRHGAYTKRYVAMAKRMHKLDKAQLESLKENLDQELLRTPKKTTAFKPVRPAASKTSARKQTSGFREPKNLESEDGDVVITHVSSAKSAKVKRPVTTTRRKLMKRAVSTSNDESGDGDEVLTRPKHSISGAKRQKVGSDNDFLDDSEDLPDANEVLQSFRWAGSGKRAR